MDVTTSAQPNRAHAWLVALLLALTGLGFARSLSGEFLYDDRLTVERNPAVADLDALVASLGSPMWEFAGAEGNLAVGYWRPLANVALAAARAAGRGDPLAFHALSVLLHLLATWAAFRLVRRVSGDETCAFFAALLFGLHPVHVEAVAWISAVNEPLCGLFVLLSVHAFLAWRERGSAGVPIAAGAWFALGLLSKELAVAAVPLAVAIDVSRRATGRERAWFPRRLVAYAPFVVVLAAWYLARAFVFESALAGFDRTTTEYGVSALRLFALRVELLGRGLGLALWPATSRVFHPFVPACSWSQLGPALIVLTGWLGLALMAWRKRSFALLFGTLAAPLALLPLSARVSSLGLFPLAERYLYVAILGVVLVLAVTAFHALPRAGAALVLTALALVLGWSTHRRSAVWHDEKTLLTTAVLEAPRSPYAHWVLGKTLLDEYQRTQDRRTLSAAEVEFRTAQDLGLDAQRGDQTIFAVRTDFLQSNLGLGWCLLLDSAVDSHSATDAKALFELVVKTYPTSAEAWTGLGAAQAALADYDAAVESLKKALTIDSRYVEAYSALGIVHMRRTEYELAVDAFVNALKYRPDHMKYLLQLARAQAEKGDDAAARRTLDRARRISPEDPETGVLVGILAARRGDLDAALREFESVLLRAPDQSEAWMQKAKVLLARGEKNGARRALLRATECDPTSYEAHYNAGALILTMDGLPAAMPYLTRAYELRARGEAGRKLRDLLSPLPIQSAETLRTLATIDADRGDADGALQWIERALEVDAQDAKSWTLRGGMLRQKGDASGAIAAFEKACELMPDNFLASEALGDLHAQAGHGAEARRSLSRALEILARSGRDDEQTNLVRRSLQDRIARLQPP